MASPKKSAKERAQSLRAVRSYSRMQQWYRVQNLAKEIYQTLLDDEQLEEFINETRHELARRIPAA